MYFDYEEFIPKRLEQLRIAKGVSARDMSLTLGQNESYINRIETEKAFPSMTVFFYICEYFGITPQQFFEEDNKNPAYVNEVMENLKKLDAKSFEHFAGLLREFTRR